MQFNAQLFLGRKFVCCNSQIGRRIASTIWIISFFTRKGAKNAQHTTTITYIPMKYCYHVLDVFHFHRRKRKMCVFLWRETVYASTSQYNSCPVHCRNNQCTNWHFSLFSKLEKLHVYISQVVGRLMGWSVATERNDLRCKHKIESHINYILNSIAAEVILYLTPANQLSQQIFCINALTC